MKRIQLETLRSTFIKEIFDEHQNNKKEVNELSTEIRIHDPTLSSDVLAWYHFNLNHPGQYRTYNCKMTWKAPLENQRNTLQQSVHERR
jgi:hypothetical protein